ncbi:MAG: ATP-dependent DNA helicase [Opitutales bacterium]
MISLQPEADGVPRWAETVMDLTDRCFGQDGWLVKELGLDDRPEQTRMARQVAAHLTSDAPLLVEAGTGVGKSLAYLVPGILQAMTAERPLVVSVHTIALQEQLQQKDLGLVRNLFQSVPELEAFATFRTAVLLGRGNYLCTTRLARARQEADDLFPSEERVELDRIANWAETTESGLRQELTPSPRPEVWDAVCADGSTCSRKHCEGGPCFYRKAKKAVDQAHVRILNHSLLFSLINAGAVPAANRRGVLVPEDFVVLDEAHTVPPIATSHFGLGISSYAVDFALKRLFNPKRKKGFLVRYGNRHRDGLLVTEAIRAAEGFFALLREQWLARRAEVRIREPDFCEPTLLPPLRRIIDRLGSLEQHTESETVVEQIRDHRSRLQSLHRGILEFISLTAEDHVHWLERSGRRQTLVHLRTAPIDVAPYLRAALFERETGVVLTSATLAVSGRMDTFQDRSGGHAAETHLERSPFPLDKHCRVLLATDSPAPTTGRVGAGNLDTAWLAATVADAVRAVPGGSLVLFTSYRDLDTVADRLAEPLATAGRLLLRQGRDGSRADLLRRFRHNGRAVLLGTDSFWTGVDVPGPALSQVIVTRLPFENPSHPIAQARMEWLREQGRNPFVEWTLPEAVIQFRQGIGRLIRNHRDCGFITILDSRMVHRPYGQAFFEALPPCPVIRFDRTNRSARLAWPFEKGDDA